MALDLMPIESLESTDILPVSQSENLGLMPVEDQEETQYLIPLIPILIAAAAGGIGGLIAGGGGSGSAQTVNVQSPGSSVGGALANNDWLKWGILAIAGIAAIVIIWKVVLKK